jgi:hypothetical protein
MPSRKNTDSSAICRRRQQYRAAVAAAWPIWVEGGIAMAKSEILNLNLTGVAGASIVGTGCDSPARRIPSSTLTAFLSLSCGEGAGNGNVPTFLAGYHALAATLLCGVCNAREEVS